MFNQMAGHLEGLGNQLLGRAQPEAEQFSQGEHVQVYSQSKKVWVMATILNVEPNGTVNVRYADGISTKALRPEEVASCIQRVRADGRRAQEAVVRDQVRAVAAPLPSTNSSASRAPQVVAPEFRAADARQRAEEPSMPTASILGPLPTYSRRGRQQQHGATERTGSEPPAAAPQRGRSSSVLGRRGEDDGRSSTKQANKEFHKELSNVLENKADLKSKSTSILFCVSTYPDINSLDDLSDKLRAEDPSFANDFKKKANLDDEEMGKLKFSLLPRTIAVMEDLFKNLPPSQLSNDLRRYESEFKNFAKVCTVEYFLEGSHLENIIGDSNGPNGKLLTEMRRRLEKYQGGDDDDDGWGIAVGQETDPHKIGNLLKKAEGNCYVFSPELISKLLKELQGPLVGREEACRLIMLGLLSSHNVFLLGPPGTGKSAICKRAKDMLRKNWRIDEKKGMVSFNEAVYFDCLLTSFTGPEDIFGPVNVNALLNGKFIRDTKGRLPTAEIAFIDETFKASKGILNSLLTILNEKTFESPPYNCPLIMALGASNEIPNSADMAALYDRFLIRGFVDRVQDQKKPASGLDLLLSFECKEEAPRKAPGGTKVPESVRPHEDKKKALYVDELNYVPALLARRDKYMKEKGQPIINPRVCELLDKLRIELDALVEDTSQNVDVGESSVAAGGLCSDRRWVSLGRLLRIIAFSNGRLHIHLVDCFMLVYCAWCKREQLEHVSSWMVYALRYYLHNHPQADNIERTRAQEDIWTDGLTIEMKNILNLETPGSFDDAVNVKNELTKPLGEKEKEEFVKDLEAKAQKKKKARELQEKMRIERESAKRHAADERELKIQKDELNRKKADARMRAKKEQQEVAKNRSAEIEKMEAERAYKKQRAQDEAMMLDQQAKDLEDEEQASKILAQKLRDVTAKQQAKARADTEAAAERARLAQSDEALLEDMKQDEMETQTFKQEFFNTNYHEKLYKVLKDSVSSMPHSAKSIIEGGPGKTELQRTVKGTLLREIEDYDTKFYQALNSIKQNCKTIQFHNIVVDKTTVLHIAARYGFKKSVSYILKESPSEIYINQGNEHGNTAMHLAAAMLELDIMKLLKNAKADVNAKNNYRCGKDSGDPNEKGTPLIMALEDFNLFGNITGACKDSEDHKVYDSKVTHDNFVEMDIFPRDIHSPGRGVVDRQTDLFTHKKECVDWLLRQGCSTQYKRNKEYLKAGQSNED